MILLHIEASPKGEYSYSSRIAQWFLDAYKADNPDDEIRTLNVFDRDLPAFGETEALAKFAPILGEQRSAEQEQAWDRIWDQATAGRCSAPSISGIPSWSRAA